MILETIPGVSQLTLEQKLILVGELWDDLIAHPTKVPVSPEQIAELEQRRESYLRQPSAVTTWEAIQKRVLGRKLNGE